MVVGAGAGSARTDSSGRVVVSRMMGMVNPRPPTQTLGNAHLSWDPDRPESIFLPAELAADAAAFYALSVRYTAVEGWNGRRVARYARASIVAAFESMEGQLNFVAYGHARAHQGAIEPVVLDILREQETVVDDRGRITQRRRLIPLTTRLSFLTLFLTGQAFPRDGQLWADLLEAIAARDRCVHPKPPFPWPAVQPSDAAFVLTAVLAVIRKISELAGDQGEFWWSTTADDWAGALGPEDVPEMPSKP